MTNGDKIRAMTDEELAYMLCASLEWVKAPADSWDWEDVTNDGKGMAEPGLAVQ